MIAGTNTDPIHLPILGLLTNKERKSGESKQKKYSWIARNMQFDHIAILLDEPGAGTPEEGIGMFVNADGQEGEVETASLVEAANSLKDGLLNKVEVLPSPTTQMPHSMKSTRCCVKPFARRQAAMFIACRDRMARQIHLRRGQ